LCGDPDTSSFLGVLIGTGHIVLRTAIIQFVEASGTEVRSSLTLLRVDLVVGRSPVSTLRSIASSIASLGGSTTGGHGTETKNTKSIEDGSIGRETGTSEIDAGFKDGPSTEFHSSKGGVGEGTGVEEGGKSKDGCDETEATNQESEGQRNLHLGSGMQSPDDRDRKDEEYNIGDDARNARVDEEGLLIDA